MNAISKAQIGAIHALKKKAGLEDDDYRAFLERETGQRSSVDLDEAQAATVIVRLKSISGGAQNASEADFNGPYGAICRALWISGYHLGVVEQREDDALLTFIRRQTKIDHVNWVRDHQHGVAVVEALKAMLARDGGVVWPRGKADNLVARKRAILAAQLRYLGVTQPPPADHEIDLVIANVGRRVRAVRKTRSAQWTNL